MWKNVILEGFEGFPRERQAKWDAEHLRTATTKLTVEEYERLREMCAAQGTTVYEILGKLVRAWMDTSPARRSPPGIRCMPRGAPRVSCSPGTPGSGCRGWCCGSTCTG